MTHFDEFRGDLISIVNPFHDGYIGISGLVMYGGFIAAIVTAALFFRIKKLPALQYLDVCSPSVGIGIALTRVGCFLNGCCYGAAVKAGSFFAINYPANGSPAAYHQYIKPKAQYGLAPSQFYESAGGLAIALIVILAGKHKRAFAGLQFYLLVTLYAVLRFFVEMTRHIETTKIGPFSHNQIICIVLFIVFGGIILKKFFADGGAASGGGINKNLTADKAAPSVDKTAGDKAGTPPGAGRNNGRGKRDGRARGGAGKN
jgi:phosphatidylglycerol:prolipoprotein diacylglycerol transferase